MQAQTGIADLAGLPSGGIHTLPRDPYKHVPVACQTTCRPQGNAIDVVGILFGLEAFITSMVR